MALRLCRATEWSWLRKSIQTRSFGSRGISQLWQLSSCLTIRSSGQLPVAAYLGSLAPQKNHLFRHAYSNGIKFLKRCAALGLLFLRASPAVVTRVFSLFGLWPLCSKRKQLFFFVVLRSLGGAVLFRS